MESIFYDNANVDNSNFIQSDSSNSINQSNDIQYNKTSKFLQYFNNQYNTNLTIDQSSIILNELNLNNMGLLTLSKIKFTDLIVLNLDSNKISDITPLKSCYFPKLKKLSICSNNKTPLENKITDISPLVNCYFPELFILNLKNNLISDLSYLLFMNFPSLIILDLSNNKIKSIHPLSSVNFPNLETLDLCNNLIKDITPLINTSGRKKHLIKSIDNNSFGNISNINNMSNVSNSLSVSQPINDLHKKNVVLPSLKILKIKHNKLIIDEIYLMTIKALKNRGISIFK